MTYQRKDRFHARAKSEGYRARSAYKLAELADRFRCLPQGARVVDLGCWPGAWLQVAAERIGPRGIAVGLDVAPTDPLPLANAHAVTGDVRDPAAIAAVRERAGGLADVVLCDVAPKLTGIRDRDEAQRADLFTGVMDALPGLLRPGGSLLVKLFMDPGHPAVVKELRSRFKDVRTTRPEATRRGSAELYAFASGYRQEAGKPCG